MGKFEHLTPAKQKAILLMTQQIIDPDTPDMKYKDIAKEVGVADSTLHYWRTEDADFMEARAELVDRYADEIIGDAFSALKYQLRKKKNVKAAEVLLKARGKLSEHGDTNVPVNVNVSVENADNDALKAELESLRSKLGVE